MKGVQKDRKEEFIIFLMNEVEIERRKMKEYETFMERCKLEAREEGKDNLWNCSYYETNEGKFKNGSKAHIKDCLKMVRKLTLDIEKDLQ